MAITDLVVSNNNTSNKTPSNPFFDLSLVRAKEERDGQQPQHQVTAADTCLQQQQQQNEQKRDDEQEIEQETEMLQLQGNRSLVTPAAVAAAATTTVTAYPLPNVTATSRDLYDVVVDDDSSVSTFGSVVSSCTSASSRRSVFSKYWSATGQSPAALSRKRSSSDRNLLHASGATPDTVASTGLVVEEGANRSLATNSSTAAAAAVVVAPPSSRRTIIFSSVQSRASCSSLPVTLEVTAEESCCGSSLTESYRKSKSTSDLECSSSSKESSQTSSGEVNTPLASCLRRDPLYSGEGGKKSGSGSSSSSSSNRIRSQSFPDVVDWEDSNSLSSSVRFDLTANDVRHFEPPQEFHAEQGWTDYFH